MFNGILISIRLLQISKISYWKRKPKKIRSLVAINLFFFFFLNKSKPMIMYFRENSLYKILVVHAKT